MSEEIVPVPGPSTVETEDGITHEQETRAGKHNMDNVDIINLGNIEKGNKQVHGI